jgi:hypothetical protein
MDDFVLSSSDRFYMNIVRIDYHLEDLIFFTRLDPHFVISTYRLANSHVIVNRVIFTTHFFVTNVGHQIPR